MGLAASQGKLLLLTARKSDLEYRAQEVSQRRLLLATDMEEISAKYARQTANRQMKLVTKTDMSEANRTKEENLTYRALMTYGTNEATGACSFRIKNALDQIVVPSESDLPNSLEKAQKVCTDSGLTFVNYHSTGSYVKGKDKDGNEVVMYFVVDKRLADESDTESPFQEGLRNGEYIIEHYGMKEAGGQSEWSPMGWSGSNFIQDVNYTGDDAKAQAEYQAASAKVQSADKRLEMELKQIETQHKAVETEVESVQKVIQNNIEGSFKLFA